jgi:hypothetical protein
MLFRTSVIRALEPLELRTCALSASKTVKLPTSLNTKAEIQKKREEIVGTAQNSTVQL